MPITKLEVLLVFMFFMYLIYTEDTANLSKTEVSQFYVVIYNRIPTKEESEYWQNYSLLVLGGDRRPKIAAVMLQSAGARKNFGNALGAGDRAVIEHIYLKLFDQTYADDPGGINYWVNRIEKQGNTLEIVIADIINIILLTDGDIKTAFNHRVEVADYAADQLDQRSFDLDLLTFDKQGLVVTKERSSVIAAKKKILLIKQQRLR
ncbi:MAG: hypothetical protein GQ582_11040 [Methyloprofundus sp.]|nr:hypothetical protein [Methyloprofundus sp.]